MPHTVAEARIIVLLHAQLHGSQEGDHTCDVFPRVSTVPRKSQCSNVRLARYT
jgi:hypothetical protein